MVKAGPSPNYLGTLSSRESHVTEDSSEDYRRLLPDRVRRESAAGIGVAARQNQQSDCKYGGGLPGNQYVLSGLSDRKVDVSAAISGRRIDRQWSRVAGLPVSSARVGALLLSDRTRDAQRLVDERVAAGEGCGRATLAGNGAGGVKLG